MSIPTLDLAAGMNWKESRLGGRKERAEVFVMSWSLVSWRQVTQGLADMIASLTTPHFTRSPRPRTFQDITPNVLTTLHIIKQVQQD